jgi:MFS transporter, DHA2 family, multidrug resistance protein
VTGSVIFSLGTAPLFTLTNDLIIGSAPPERAGAAAGISETAAEFGGALGIAFFGSIGTAIYRGAMAGGIPDGVPQAAAETARDTLGGAVEVAARLPDPLGPTLIDAAREAFIQGLNLTAAISSVGTIGMAVFIAVVLRRMRLGSGPEGDADLEEEPAIA